MGGTATLATEPGTGSEMSDLTGDPAGETGWMTGRLVRLLRVGVAEALACRLTRD